MMSVISKPNRPHRGLTGLGRYKLWNRARDKPRVSPSLDLEWVDYSDESEDEPDSDREKQPVAKAKATAWTTLPEK